MKVKRKHLMIIPAIHNNTKIAAMYTITHKYVIIFVDCRNRISRLLIRKKGLIRKQTER